MAWKDVMAATIRLSDLYSSKRTPGPDSAATQVPLAENNQDDPHAGVLFDLGTAILEFLDEHDARSAGSYALQGEVYEGVRQDFSTCSEEDFLFVVQKLSLRYSVYFSRDQVILKTALIERAPAGKRIRLSPKGRLALTLSESVEDWAYLDLDAERIVRAIARGNFGEVAKFAVAMSQKIRDVSLEIRTILELPSADLQAQSLYSENELYMETVTKVQDLITEALNVFETDATISKMDQWLVLHPEEEGVQEEIEIQLYRTLSMIETVSRNLAKIISSVQSGGGRGVRTVNFIGAAEASILRPDCEERIESAFDYFVLPISSLHESIQDVVRPLTVAKNPSRESLVFDVSDAEPVEGPPFEFFHKHGEAFERAAAAGPLSLGSELRRGGLGMSSISGVEEAISVFLDASAMGFEGRFQVSPGQETHILCIEGREVTVQDLVVQKVGENER
jgi:hypothetical protein